jgi:serine/threonine-protein kinase
MAPERFHGQATRQSDVFATGVVLWEALTGGRLFRGEDDITSRRGGGARVAPPSALMADSSVLGVDADLLARLDDVTLRALEWDPEQRFGTAREMAVALEEAVSVASPVEIGAWVEALAGERLVARAERLLEIESSPGWRDGGADTAARAREDSISTTTTLGAPLEEKRPAGRRLRVWAFGAVLVVGLATAARASVRGAESTTLAAAAPPAEVDANVAAPPPTTEPSVTAASGVPGSSPPSPEAIAVPHASPGHPRARPSAPARRQCDPPYTIDDHGRKHFKEQCFP